MLQTNLIFGIQKKIKAGSKHAHKMGLVEESTEYKRHTANGEEPILESSFVAGIYEQAHAAKKKEESKKTLVTEAFHLTKARKKLEKDFNYLYENFVDDVFKDQYKILLESVFEDTIRLYQECDVTPRLASPALDSNELNESQIIDIYKNKLNETIKNNYTKPILSGAINELYENEIRTLTKKLITEGSDLDMEQVRVYLPFEETIYKFNKEILVPEIAENRVKAFMESMTEDYLEFIDESAADILQTIEKKIKLLSSLISPNMFEKAVDAEGVEAPKMAGISITVDKNFDEDSCDDGICPDEIAATDPEAAEEMADEEEAEELEVETGDIPETEEKVRDNMDLATDSEDYENGSLEDEADESATEETAEHPDQPGAVEMDLAVQDGDLDPNTGIAANGDDVELQGEGNDHGEDPAVGAKLPGNTEAVGEEVDSDEIGDEIDELQAKEEVDSDDSELSEDEEEKEEVEEGTIQDKKPQPQNTHGNRGTMPNGGTTQDKGIAGANGAGNSAGSMPGGGVKDDKSLSKGQGGAPKSKGTMPNGGTTQDRSISGAKNASNSKGASNPGKVTQDKHPGSQGGAPNKSGSMPGGGTTQDKHLS